MAWYNRIWGNNTPKKQKRKAYQRSYTGANTGRLFADFVTSSTSADAEIKDNFVKLPLIMKFNKPIINLEIKIILESLDKKDLRVYQLFLDIHPKPTLAKIEMVASLGDTII